FSRKARVEILVQILAAEGQICSSKKKAHSVRAPGFSLRVSSEKSRLSRYSWSLRVGLPAQTHPRAPVPFAHLVRREMARNRIRRQITPPFRPVIRVAAARLSLTPEPTAPARSVCWATPR